MTVAISRDLDFLSISEAGSLFRSKKLSPVELVQSHLAKIEKTQPTINAFITILADLALEQAKAAEQAIQAGDTRPLLGIPIGYKDIYMTAGILTTAGSAVHANYVPPITATTVTKLEEAGAVTLGKLATHEFAAGLSTEDHPFPPAHNPWNLDHVPGGSSSGSGAALAAGLAIGTLGTDTGGSIRWPGAACGIAALKPTYGRCSRYGVFTLSWSLDHTGPMARNCEDVALMLNALAGYDPKDPASANVPTEDYAVPLKSGIAGLKLGVLKSWYEDKLASDELKVMAEAISVFKDLGAEIVELDLPHVELIDSAWIISMAEAYAYHAKDLKETPQLYPGPLRNRFKTGGLFTAEEYINAQRGRAIFNAGVKGLMKEVDLLISPTWGAAAASFASMYAKPLQPPGYNFTRAFNMTGSPALSVLCGFNDLQLPVGLQIIGRAFDEATVLRAGHAYEQAAGWLSHHPQV